MQISAAFSGPTGSGRRARSSSPSSITAAETRPGPAFRAVSFALILLAFVRWVLPIRSSLWLDETSSWWTIKEGFLAIPQRCTQHPVSVAYMQILWAFQKVLGHSEWALRASSLVFMLAAVWVLYAIANILFSRDLALVAVVVYMAFPNVAFGSGDVRPYALATFLAVLSTLLVVNWVRRSTAWRAAFYAASVGFLFDVHYLFMLVVLPHLVFVAVRIRRGFRPDMKQAAILCAVAFAVASPSIAPFLSLANARGHFSFAPPPRLADLFRELVPRVVLAPAIVALVVLVLRRGSRRVRGGAAGGAMVLAVSWAAAPVLALYAVSTLSGSTVFQPRYLLVAAPGLALVYAALVDSIRPPVARLALVSLVVLSGFAQAWITGALFSHTAPTLGNWRDALAYVDAQAVPDHAPVLIRSQFIESDYMDWQAQPIRDNPVFTPLSYYASPADFVPLPVSLSAAASQLETFAAGVFQYHKPFFLVSADGPRPLRPFLTWFKERWPGLSVRKARDCDGILVYAFQQ